MIVGIKDVIADKPGEGEEELGDIGQGAGGRDGEVLGEAAGELDVVETLSRKKITKAEKAKRVLKIA